MLTWTETNICNKYIKIISAYQYQNMTWTFIYVGDFDRKNEYCISLKEIGN